MACVSNALVIGGGIGGLAAALALSKIGVRCEVVELAEVPLGASLAFSGRAAEALDELGIYDDACKTGTVFGPDSTATSIRNAEGELLSAGMQRPTWPGCKDGVAVYRPVFLDIVAAAAEKMGVSIRKGLTAEKIENSEKTALVTFADGEQRCYDLVIGSDGIGSHTRNLLYPDAPKPAYAGQMSVRWDGSRTGYSGRGMVQLLSRQTRLLLPAARLRLRSSGHLRCRVEAHEPRGSLHDLQGFTGCIYGARDRRTPKAIDAGIATDWQAF